MIDNDRNAIVLSRNVLFFSQSDLSADFEDSLKSVGWHLRRYGDTNHGKHEESPGCSSEIHGSKIGLVLFKGYNAEWIKAWESVYRNSDGMQWLALVDKSAIADERLKELILNRCHDFHTLPIDLDRLKMALGHAYGLAQLYQKFEDSKINPHKDGLIGVSKSIQELRKIIEKASQSDSPVMICGESGTGKELVASAIHAQSGLRNKSFVAVNCASIPGSLIQSELFGHEKGAFTGANAQRIGRIEQAAGGSLFLDEIGDLGLDFQVNLLRFLQEKSICRLGGHQEFKVDARVIAATHVNLENAIKQGSFREDLYYRLNVLRINISPLRERREDIEYLARHFFDKFKLKTHSQVLGFRSDALIAMRLHHWPGNVRELINRIHQATIMAAGKLITPDDLGLQTENRTCLINDLETARAEAERKTILAMTTFTRRNMSEAARRLGVTRATLYRLIYKHKLESDLGFHTSKAQAGLDMA